MSHQVFTHPIDLSEYYGFVLTVTICVCRRRRNIDDEFQEGFVGLLEAARNFDPTRGVQFNSYAYPYVRGRIIDWLEKNRPYRERHRPLKREPRDPQINRDPFEQLELDDFIQTVTKNRSLIRMVYIEERTRASLLKETGKTDRRNISGPLESQLQQLRDKYPDLKATKW